MKTFDEPEDGRLVEMAPEETVLPALLQSAHPVEFSEANPPAESASSTDRS